MANKNDSSRVKECLTYPDEAGQSGAREKDGSSSKRRHSDPSSADVPDSRQRSGAEAHSRNRWREGTLKREPECHMQLDSLSPNRVHTVLIDVRAFIY